MSDNDISERARQLGGKALDALESVLDPETSPFAEVRDRIRAAEAILDRGYGKAAQAIIAVPANRRQAALLASISDDQLVAVIERKQLPQLSPSQKLVNVDPPKTTEGPSAANPRNLYKSVTVHGPLLQMQDEDEVDPLLA